MIYIDPTEAKENTRLPQSIIDAAQILPGLESFTGADMLIYDGEVAPVESLESIPEQLRFRRMCQEGALIQRKTERDICGSIPHLKDILCRMLEWTPMPWLIVDGLILRIKGDKLGFYSHDKRQYIPTEFSYKAYLSGILYWQFRGGYYTNLSNVNDWPGLVNLMTSVMAEVKAEPIKAIVHAQYQSLESADWKDTLATLPGIGSKRAREWAGKNLAETLCTLTRPDGSKTRDNIRRYMGLDDKHVLCILEPEDIPY